MWISLKRYSKEIQLLCQFAYVNLDFIFEFMKHNHDVDLIQECLNEITDLLTRHNVT